MYIVREKDLVCRDHLLSIALECLMTCLRTLSWHPVHLYLQINYEKYNLKKFDFVVLDNII